jgi:hypothetical protein
MFCTRCGSPLDVSGRYCRKCGQAFVASSAGPGNAENRRLSDSKRVVLFVLVGLGAVSLVMFLGIIGALRSQSNSSGDGSGSAPAPTHPQTQVQRPAASPREQLAIAKQKIAAKDYAAAETLLLVVVASKSPQSGEAGQILKKIHPLVMEAKLSEQAKEHPQQSLAQVKCEEAVTLSLKAPQTAHFESVPEVQDLGKWRYQVNSYVDAENEFGGHPRAYYTCKVQCVDVDACQVISVKFP